MYLQRFPPTNRTVEADRDTFTHNGNLSPHDSESERPPEYSLKDTLGVAGASQVATPNSSYSKCPSGNISLLLNYLNFVSILPDLC